MGDHQNVESSEIREGVRKTVETIVREVQPLDFLTQPPDVCRETWGEGELERGTVIGEGLGNGGEGEMSEGVRGVTCAGLGAGVIRVTGEMSEDIVGEMKVCQFWHLEETTWNIGDLIMRGIKISQTVGERERGEGGEGGRRDREGEREGGRGGRPE